jgi:hypothetical protein
MLFTTVQPIRFRPSNMPDRRSRIAADQTPGFVSKYDERIAPVFGSVDEYSRQYSVPVLIAPRKLHA